MLDLIEEQVNYKTKKILHKITGYCTHNNLKTRFKSLTELNVI
jgi:ribosomal protein S17E